MIYVSCLKIKDKNVSQAVEILAKNGIQNIELSGGFSYYEGLYNDLFLLKERYNLNFLVHNYFPPPKEPFVLNLASLDEEIFSTSLNHYKKSINLALELGCSKYSLHAGFLLNPKVNELGNVFVQNHLFDRVETINKFILGLNILKDLFADKIDVYIENNVISYDNYIQFGKNPCLLTCFDDYLEMKNLIDFNLLLDLGHLMVSSNTLGLDFENEFKKFINLTDYLHISHNNLISDQHVLPKKNTFVYNYLKANRIGNKIITLEVQDDIDNIVDLYKEMSEWD